MLRSLRFLPLLFCLATVTAASGQSGSSSTGSSKETKKPAVVDRTVAVAFTDGSHLKVQLAEDTIELQTPHGKLNFPIADIQKIEFAYRVPEDVAFAIDKAITDLGSTDFKAREQAMVELLEQKERSYAALVRASKQQSDFEMRQRIEQLIEKLRKEVPEEQLNVRVHDYVYTADSKIAGKLTSKNFKISSSQFGQLQLKLSDIRDLRLPGATPELSEDDPKNVLPDPGNMKSYEHEIGKSFAFRVTGNPSSFCFGTDTYTTDSNIGTAAVHAGVLKPGETAVLVATVVPSPPGFVSSSRNGVHSSAWSAYPAAYTLRRAKTAPK